MLQCNLVAVERKSTKVNFIFVFVLTRSVLWEIRYEIIDEIDHDFDCLFIAIAVPFVECKFSQFIALLIVINDAKPLNFP